MWNAVRVLIDNKKGILLDDRRILDIVNDEGASVFAVTYIDPTEDDRDMIAWWYSDQDLIGGGLEHNEEGHETENGSATVDSSRLHHCFFFTFLQIERFFKGSE